MEKKAKQQLEDDEGVDSESMEEEEEFISGRDALLPSVNDPKLWQLRVKRGCERAAVLQLIKKSEDMARKKRPLAILSATASDVVEGFIYIEAYKDEHVRMAIQGLNSFIGNGRGIKILPQNEMPEIYQIDKARDMNVKPNSFIRIK